MISIVFYNLIDHMDLGMIQSVDVDQILSNYKIMVKFYSIVYHHHHDEMMLMFDIHF
ncbi:unnamed protein product [Schistosoma curassoni]|uniref:Uncharacterized protein n=1 Tax=Schistosoma curassoni TaxID=6186 RepID=A0A183JM71_9TREM|nr:unnamed protein product [Schistosoma curassoni]